MTDEMMSLQDLLGKSADADFLRELIGFEARRLANAVRAHLAEFGIVAAQGLTNAGRLLTTVIEDDDDRIPRRAYDQDPRPHRC